MDINCTVFGQAIAFWIFVFLCMRYIWPILIGIIENRRKKISDSFLAIQVAEKNIKSSYMKVNNLIHDAEIKAKKIIDEAKQYRDSMLNEAKNEAVIEKNKIIQEAYVKINLKKKCIEKELREQVIKIIILATKKILINSVDLNQNCEVVKKIISKFW
ncbi:MAG: ATP synthase Fo complex subunit b [Candidatus Westeberhardia cardiocondylae]|nr:ATP synthase Fo complex subunit b [Candidatus Westeberhardia cardiocondylae]